MVPVAVVRTGLALPKPVPSQYEPVPRWNTHSTLATPELVPALLSPAVPQTSSALAVEHIASQVAGPCVLDAPGAVTAAVGAVTSAVNVL